MNKKDKKRLAFAVGSLIEANDIISELANAEQEKYDNMPESLQSGSRGETMSANADTLQSANDGITTAIEELEGLQ